MLSVSNLAFTTSLGIPKFFPMVVIKEVHSIALRCSCAGEVSTRRWEFDAKVLEYVQDLLFNAQVPCKHHAGSAIDSFWSVVVMTWQRVLEKKGF